MAVDRLGGEVEGQPTQPLNFLQRIDALVGIEIKHAALKAEVDEPAEMCENCDDNYLPSTMRVTEDDVRLCRRCYESCCEESSQV
jgi:hypothetical protein